MSIKEAGLNFIRFSRFHTIIGTTLSIVVLFLIAWFMTDPVRFPGGLLAITLIACLGANIFIVGLNQITDIEIDKINKPYLPLASGAFSLRTGYVLIIIGLILALALATIAGPYLLLTVVLSLALGTAYSLPPFRLKRFHFWAAFCIIAVRGLIVNLLIFLHFQYQMSGSETLPPAILLLTIAMFGYSLVIAWFKDIPDMAGDAKHRIKTMSIRLGAKRVFRIGNLLMSVLLLFLAGISFFVPLGLNPIIMALAHGIMLLALWLLSWQTAPENKASSRKYYLFIWVLFFAEYLSFVLAAGV